MKIASGVYKLTFGTPEDMTPVSVIRPKSDFKKINSLKDYDMPFCEDGIGFKVRTGGCLLEIPLSPEEDIYGLGLMMKSFKQTGLKKMLRANSDPTADTGDSHAPVPFYLSTAGYGILVDTARYATFYMGNCKIRGSKQDLDNYASAGTEVGHWWTKSGSGNAFIDIPAAKGVDIYIFCGEDLKDALSRYNLFAGGGTMPPIWGLGVMYRAYMNGDKDRILSLAKELREEKMPCDIFGFEPGWQTHFYSCTYVWDENRFPEHEKMLKQLNDMGYKVNLWEHAYTNPESPVFEKLKPYSGDQYVWDGLIPDFNTDGAKKVFGEYHAKLAGEGISGFKLDECDNSDFTANWGFANFTEFPSGLDGEQMHMLFGLLYQKTMSEIYEKEGVRTWGEVRNSGALASPYPYVLYSDLYEHEDFVRGMAGALCSGILWTPEVRQADSDEELLSRIAAAVVSPQMVLNCYQVQTPPWTQWDMWKNLDGIRLDNADELTDKCRELFEMRMRLIPLLYTAYYNYYKTGIPPIRPLVLDYPKDKEARPLYDEFILGEGLLAAPVIFKHGTLRKIWLPEGTWYDYLTDEKIKGEAWIERETKPGDIPLFVKEGTLLVIAEPEQYITDATCFKINVIAYGESSVKTVLIDDDGITNAYKSGVKEIEVFADADSAVLSEETKKYQLLSFKRVK